MRKRYHSCWRIAAVLCCLLFTGCAGDPAVPEMEKAERLVLGQDPAAMDERDILTVLAAAETANGKLENSEERYMFYTKYGDVPDGAEDILDVVTVVYGRNTDDPVIVQTGSMKSGDVQGGLELYYSRGTLYYTDGENKLRQSCELAEALRMADMLSEFMGILNADNLHEVTAEAEGDGLMITAGIEGEYLDADMSGTATFRISGEGYMISRSLHLKSAHAEAPEARVIQSIESSLLARDGQVEEPQLPDFSQYKYQVEQ